MGHLVLVTGSSSGIGLATAVACAAAGHRVVATMRRPEKAGALLAAAAARGASLQVEPLDVASQSAPDRVREILQKHGPVYALVNNAGIAVGGAFEEQADDDVRAQFETNVFGLMATTRAVLPAMRSAGRGRIINVSSVSGLVGLPGVSAYAATKHAVEGFSEALRWEVAPFGVHVCLIEPGTFKTEIFFENQRRGAHVSPEGPYAAMTRTIEQLVLQDAAKAPPPAPVAAAILRLIEDPSPPFRTLIGRDARTLVALRRVIPDRLFATGIRRLVSAPRPR